MNINNYWSKKSHQIASQIFRNNLRNNNIIMDPFLGSGTSLQGIKELNIDLKFIGVELNEMPLAYANFNANPPTKEDLIKMSKEFTDFYNKNKNFYEFKSEKDEIYELEKVILDLPSDKVEVKSFNFKDSNSKTFTVDRKKNLNLFNFYKNIYLNKSNQAKKNIKKDLLLDENSRIAIKSQMYISHLYGPISFYLLQKICDKFKENELFKVVISSILHLTKYTDLRAQIFDRTTTSRGEKTFPAILKCVEKK